MLAPSVLSMDASAPAAGKPASAAACRLDQPAPGLEIDLETRYGTFKYHVTGSTIVNPNNRSVLIPDAPGYHLTLTTCWPLWAVAFATQRYVIFTDQYSPQMEPRGYR